MFEIGNSLREARLRQKLDFPELEQAVKIRGKYLRALEDEQFDTLPAQTYVKGFLRAYAEHLGLDGQLYVDEYNSRFVTDDEHHPVRPRRSSARPRHHRRMETHVLVIALTAIVTVTVLVFAAWKFGGSSEDQTAVPNLTRKSAQPKAKTKPVRRAAPAVPAKPAAAKRAQVVATAAAGDCWLEVHTGSATGRLLFEGTLEHGQTQRFSAPKIWMNVGVPENLRLKLNGKRIRIPGSGAPQVLVVTPSGISSAA